MKRNTLLIIVFFALLSFGLFLGDGKQGVIDIYGASIAMVLWGLYAFVVGPQPHRRLPRGVGFAWIAVAAAAFLSTMHSDDIGYSISWFVRFASGYLVYRLFFDMASGEIARFFYVLSLLFVGVAAILSLAIRSFVWFGTLLPSMNLLDVRFGHSHLADLFVFAFPLVFYIRSALHLKRRQAVVMFVAYFALLLFTFARGAWLVVGGYACYEAVAAAKNSKRRIWLFGGAAIIFLLVLASVFGRQFLSKGTVARTPGYLNEIVRQQTVSARFEYWRQALVAFSERPLLGSGPGTFSLESTRLQRGPGQASWFAHSEPLQILAEMGIIGFVCFAALVWVHSWKLKFFSRFRTRDIERALFFSCILLLVYGSFEFVLDYCVTWLLFWAALGMVLGLAVPRGDNKKNNPGIVIPLCFTAIFYVLWTSSQAALIVSKRYDVAFYLAPFDAAQTLMYLKTVSINDAIPIQLVTFIHQRNPQTEFLLGDAHKARGKYHEAEKFYKIASHLSPNDSTYYGSYFAFLAERNKSGTIGKELLALSAIALPEKYHTQIQQLAPFATTLGIYYKNWMVEEHPSYKNGYAGIYYRLGISDLRNVEPIEKLLILARDIYPDLGYLHVELASFYYHIQHNREKYKRVLKHCLSFPSAAEQCKQQMMFRPYYPGEYKDVIW